MTKKHSWILSAMLVSSFWSGTVMAAPAANPAGDGLGVAIGTGSSAARDTSVAVGKNAKKIEEYIRNQLEEDRMGEQLTMGNF